MSRNFIRPLLAGVLCLIIIADASHASAIAGKTMPSSLSRVSRIACFEEQALQEPLVEAPLKSYEPSKSAVLKLKEGESLRMAWYRRDWLAWPAKIFYRLRYVIFISSSLYLYLPITHGVAAVFSGRVEWIPDGWLGSAMTITFYLALFFYWYARDTIDWFYRNGSVIALRKVTIPAFMTGAISLALYILSGLIHEFGHLAAIETVFVNYTGHITMYGIGESLHFPVADVILNPFPFFNSMSTQQACAIHVAAGPMTTLFFGLFLSSLALLIPQSKKIGIRFLRFSLLLAGMTIGYLRLIWEDFIRDVWGHQVVNGHLTDWNQFKNYLPESQWIIWAFFGVALISGLTLMRLLWGAYFDLRGGGDHGDSPNNEHKTSAIQHSA